MITDYASLQAAIATLLNRTDLTDAIKGFIQDVESELRDDDRARKLTDRGTLSVSGDGMSLPSDLTQIESWYHDGSSYYGPIEIVSANQIPELKLRCGASGVPAYAAITDGKARFAPAPDGTYSTKMTYWRSLTPLSTSNTTNWLLLTRPDIYKYGAARFSAPMLRDDTRLAVWDAIYQRALEQLSDATQREQYGGSLRRQFTPIG